jgi:hypothetical protein
MATNKIPGSPIETVFAPAGETADRAAAQGASTGLVQNTQTTVAATSDRKNHHQNTREGNGRSWIVHAPARGEHTRPRVFRSAPPRSGRSAGHASLPSANKTLPAAPPHPTRNFHRQDAKFAKEIRKWENGTCGASSVNIREIRGLKPTGTIFTAKVAKEMEDRGSFTRWREAKGSTRAPACSGARPRDPAAPQAMHRSPPQTKLSRPHRPEPPGISQRQNANDAKAIKHRSLITDH